MRVAFLLDSLTVPAWLHEAIRLTVELPGVVVPCVVLNEGGEGEAPNGSKLARYWRNRDTLLFSAFRRFDSARAIIPNDPFAPMDARALLAGAELLQVAPRRTAFSDFFPDDRIEALRRFDLDLAVRGGFRILRGPVLSVPRLGIWSYHHDANEDYRGGPPGFWEVLEDNPVTGTVLQVLSESLDGGRVLYRSYGSTDRLSVAQNVARLYWKSSAFLARAVREAQRTGTLPEPIEASDPLVPYGRRLYTVPDNRTLARPLARLVGRRLRNSIEGRVSWRQWMLAFRFAPKGAPPADEPDTTLFRFTPIIPPADRFWADPFPVADGDRHVVLLEELPYASDRGHISAMEIRADGTWTPPVPVLTRPYHLSYPFVFDWRGDRWMIPETQSARTVELYRCVRFPDEWTLEAELMRDVQLFDVTLHEEAGRWWMFAGSAARHASRWDELSIFAGDSPLGPWTPHLRNPVVSDVRRARPAGRLFRSGGRLYRPAQDSARGYGHAIALQRVDRLALDDYAETTVGRLLPEWMPRLQGTHTINRAGRLTVVDGLLRRGGRH